MEITAINKFLPNLFVTAVAGFLSDKGLVPPSITETKSSWLSGLALTFNLSPSYNFKSNPFNRKPI